ncbi:hypothetical protein [Nocardiopsis coralli]|uniref:hypothetical protein n=1 Tax=Nocardiopsis coralli TaxID=2772213 RepID=UPI001C10A8FE|nr:hypothetical protein [Nocardiopsis coralli]
MAGTERTAAEVVQELLRLQDDAELEKVRKRLAPDEEAFGLRMRHLFDVSKAHTDLAQAEVERLLDRTPPTSRAWPRCASSTSRPNGNSATRSAESCT